MIDLELSWRAAAGTAAVLGIATAALRTARRPRLATAAVATKETALILGLFALWQFAGSFAVMGPEHALARSRWIWHAEQVLHLPSETSVQSVFLPHPLVVQFFNLYYDSLHFPVLITCMIWLFVRHRDDYKRLRTTLVALTGSCLLVQLIPVAPPRMLPATHMVDTAIRFGHALGARRLGHPRRDRGDRLSKQQVALARTALPRHDLAGGCSDGQSFLARRDRRRRPARRRSRRPERGPEADGRTCRSWPVRG